MMPRLSNADRQRLYRQRRDQDQTRRALYLEKRRTGYKNDKASGKRPAISAQTPRAQRTQRKQWREQKRDYRHRQKVLGGVIGLSPPQTPDMDRRNQCDAEQCTGSQRGRKRTMKGRSRINRENQKLKELVQKRTKEAHKFRMRYNRLKKTNRSTDSPRTKTKKLLSHWNKDGRSDQVKKTLNFHFALVQNLQEQYRLSKSNREKRRLQSIICGKLIRKYRLLTRARMTMGSNCQRRGSTNQSKHSKLWKIRREKVLSFYIRDDVSRVGAGKKNTITLRKMKKQRRLLLDSLQNLHLKFLSESEVPISYPAFCKLRPFWVVTPTERDRETCQCVTHENLQFIVDKLHQVKLSNTKNLSEITASLVCSTTSKDCAYGTCDNCNTTEYRLENIPSEESVSLPQWERKKVQRQGKGDQTYECVVTVKAFRKVTQTSLVELFESSLPKFQQHSFNIRWQFAMYRRLRESLQDNECLIHVDFSEDYQCRYSSEVQSVHFGGSRQQACLHTGVFYLKNQPKAVSFCSISDSTRHDPAAIWAHLHPLLEMIQVKHPAVDTLYFWSDSPSTQYRQKSNFYLMSTEPFKKGFKKVSWNFFEAGHGKGAPDGVGGSLKRSADALSRQGRDVPDALSLFSELVGNTDVQLFYIDEAEVEAKSVQLSTAGRLKPIKGTMLIHQATCLSPRNLTVRDVSCFCSRQAGILSCSCFSPRNVRVDDLDSQDAEREGESESHSSGKGTLKSCRPSEITTGHINQWCLVEYDHHAYPGIIQAVEEREIMVKCMHPVGFNRFLWPAPHDDINWSAPSEEEKENNCSNTETSTEYQNGDRISETEKIQQTQPKKRRCVKFVKSWLTNPEFKQWLMYDIVANKMFCRMCKAKGCETVWATSGTDNFRLKTLQSHVVSEAHTRAALSEDPHQRSILDVRKELSEQERASYTAALKTVYWIVTEEIANRKYTSLLNFQRNQGVTDIIKLRRGANSTKESPQVFNDMLAALNKVLVEETVSQMRRSCYLGIGIDESTDRSSEKHVVFVVRYEADEQLKTTYLRMKQVENCKAATIYETLCAVLKEYGIAVQKIQGLGIDGASVMLSDQNGVAGLLKKDNPFCIPVHCVCHRLHLAVSKAAKRVPSVDMLQTIAANIYQHVNNSSNRLAKFENMSKILAQTEENGNNEDEDGMPAYNFLKFRKIFEIRWLCLGEAVKAIIHNYHPLLLLLEEEASKGDPVSIGLSIQLKNYRVAAMFHLVCDVLSATNHLNQIFQYRNLTFHGIKPQIQRILNTLEDMRTENCYYMATFQKQTEERKHYMADLKMTGGRGELLGQREQFAVDRDRFICEVTNNIRSRFPQLELLDAMQIFEPSAYPAQGEPLNFWGLGYLDTILEHYSQQKETPHGVFNGIVDADSARGEFLMFKRTVDQNRGMTDDNGDFQPYDAVKLFSVLFGGVNRANRRIFREMHKLMLLSLVVMPSNAEAERSFSVQNRLKTKLRNKLSIDRLDQLIRLSYTNLPVENFPFEKALEKYMSQPHRWY